MKRNVSLILNLILFVATAGCQATHDAMEEHQRIVARVDRYTLTVDHAAELLSRAAEGVAPPVPAVADPFVDFWIAYTLLAIELASPDSFSDVDLDALVGTARDQELVWQLHEEVIVSRLIPPEPELRELYERNRPFDRVNAQHIMVAVPQSATPEQLDSLRRVADDLRARVLAGADFNQMARQYSDDPATASQGGRLGWVDRGQLIPGLDQTLFEMEPGEISETVRSSAGYHILQVIEKETPDFEMMQNQYRTQLLETQIDEAESEYIASLVAKANVKLARGAISLAQNLVNSPRLERLTPSERSAALAVYKGGALTVGEFADFVIRGIPSSRAMFSSADSAQVHTVLLEMVRSELLAKAARDQGYELTTQQADSLRDSALRELFVAAFMAGYRREQLGGGEAIMLAVDRAVTDVLRRERSPEPIQRVMPALRGGHVVSVYPSRFPEVAARLAELLVERGGTGEQTATPARRPSAAGEPERTSAGTDRGS